MGKLQAVLGRAALCMAALVVGGSVGQAQAAGSRRDSVWAGVDAAIGRAGVGQPGEVWKYSFPRSDLAVTVAGVRLRPAFALGGWIAFHRMGDSAMAMGDLVLRDSEVRPVLRKGAGIDVTAIHNHLVFETPRLFFVHFWANGPVLALAGGLKTALDLTNSRPPAR